MKVSEIRIGCNFQLENGVLGGKIATIKNKYDLDVAFDLLESNLIKPIPLTEEWLLKFGFERTDQKDNSNDDCIWLFYQKDKIYIDGSDLTIETASGIVIKIEYVHQLQNLYFALIGEELTFKSE